MKLLKVLFTVLSIASIPTAHSAQVSQVELSEAAAAQTIQMLDQRFEPIYEQQPYQATCNREVLDHMATTCSTVSDTVCHGVDREVCETQADQVCNSHGCTTVPRRVCHQESRTCEVVPRRVCSDHAVMRTEYYSCTQYRTVQVGQRLVKTFEHNVEVVVDRPELLQGQRLVISLLAREDSVSATLVSSFSLNLLTVESQRLSNSDSGSSAILGTRILIHVGASTASIGKILSSSVQNLELHSSGISLDLPGVAELANNLVVSVTLSQRRAIINDKQLFHGSLSAAKVSVSQGDALKVTIPLAKMNIDELKAKRHSVSVSVSLQRTSLTILNSNDLSAIINKRLEASLSNVIPH